MPVEALPSPLRQPRLAPTPPRLRPKVPLGPAFARPSPPPPAPRPKQSAVERLEADKAKYVKSRVALSKQQPVVRRPATTTAELRKPLITAMTRSTGGGGALRPTRRTPAPQPGAQQTGVALDLEHLSNLISGVNDGPISSSFSVTTTVTPTTVITSPLRGPVRAEHHEPVQSSSRPPPAAAAPLSPHPAPPAAEESSTPANVRLKACSPLKAEPPQNQNQDPASTAASVAVRRVDVVPQGVRASRKPPATAPRGPLAYMRQPLYPVGHGVHPFRPATSNQRLLFPPRTPLAPPTPIKPLRAPPKPEPPPTTTTTTPPPTTDPPALPPRSSSSSSPPPAILPPPVQTSSPRVFPGAPPSPALTRLSSTSSARKRPSLTRSKSDMSDRCSRAGTELERFFNLCGLDPADVPELAAAGGGGGGPGSDIVSLARFRSASAPGSEVTGPGEDDEDEEGGGGDEGAVRVPYGVSVIERNARVIKWLYGIRHEAKDANKSTNM